jgi:hypothetical protein
VGGDGDAAAAIALVVLTPVTILSALAREERAHRAKQGVHPANLGRCDTASRDKPDNQTRGKGRHATRHTHT